MSDNQITDAVKARLLREAEQETFLAIACVPNNAGMLVLVRVLAKLMVRVACRKNPHKVLDLVRTAIGAAFVHEFGEHLRRQGERRKKMN